MSITVCDFCNHGNSQSASFCQRCGRVLAATTVQGRTVVMNGTPPPNAGTVPHFDAKSVVDRVTKAFGNQSINHFPTTPTAVSNQREDTFFVEDVSYSMDEEMDQQVPKIEGLRRASVSLVMNKNQIDPEDRIGLVTFDSRARRLLPLVEVGVNKPLLIKTIQGMTTSGGTNIESGIALARDEFDWNQRDRVRRIVLLTDGEDSGNPLPLAEELKARGVVIDTIGIGNSPSEVNEKLLKCMASTIEGELRYRFIKDHQSLIKHFTQLATKTATQA